MINIKNTIISNRSVFPIVEGGKGISVSNGLTAGSFANAGAVGTISGTNADFYDQNGNLVRYTYPENSTRKEKFELLVKYSIEGAISQAKIAHDIANNQGRIHLNLLWEAGGTKRILESVLESTKGLIHGITCGAGLPYALSDIAEKYNVYYYPIVSSARAFQILWKRSYHKLHNLLGGVVYEDPWLAGGHNGLSNSEDPNCNQDPFARVSAIRKFLNSVNLQQVPIIIAGGVWNLTDWSHYLNNPEIGEVAFQFGTRPLLTKESPLSKAWKNLLLTLKERDILLHRFSPTGFYSSAIKNKFLRNLEERSQRQMPVSRKATAEFTHQVPAGNGISSFYVTEHDHQRALQYIEDGYSILMKTPDDTVIFETPKQAQQIKIDQKNCMGCLHACKFSSWREDNATHSTGIKPDPRSFCIQKTLQDVSHDGSVVDNLLFAGHHAYKFAQDPLYQNGNVPTISELVNTIMQGK